ncbi:hypothetical protein Tco_0905923, partial [Tanacetum coccineum]
LPSETKRIERYIYGLALQIREMVVATEPRKIQSAILKARALTDQTVRNRSLKRSGERRRDGEELSKEWNVKSDNKRARTGKDYRARPRIVNPLNARNPTTARGACYECGGTDNYKSECPRLNRALGRERNRPNQAMAIEGG